MYLYRLHLSGPIVLVFDTLHPMPFQIIRPFELNSECPTISSHHDLMVAHVHFHCLKSYVNVAIVPKLGENVNNYEKAVSIVHLPVPLLLVNRFLSFL